MYSIGEVVESLSKLVILLMNVIKKMVINATFEDFRYKRQYFSSNLG